MTTFWSVPREWPGETVFIVGGGPSVRGQDLEVLRGRRVIVINSSVHAVPWADILYFGDARWWHEPDNRAAVDRFAGRVVTTRRVPDKRVLLCRRTHPPGLATARDTLAQKWTSLTAATNLAAHLVGAGGTIVWLGADGRIADDGYTHHHKPHPWPTRRGCYEVHRDDLKTIIPSLRQLGIAAFNASPGTAWTDLLPVVNLQDMLDESRVAA